MSQQYSEQDRDEHYRAEVEQQSCSLCLLGMSSSHGAGLNVLTERLLGPNWWRSPMTADQMPSYDAAERAVIAAEVDPLSSGYWSASVVVDGALEHEDDVSPEGLDELLKKTKDEASADGLPTEVFAIWHEHAPRTDDDDAEDVCAQYATDHRPIWSSEDDDGLDSPHNPTTHNAFVVEREEV